MLMDKLAKLGLVGGLGGIGIAFTGYLFRIQIRSDWKDSLEYKKTMEIVESHGAADAILGKPLSYKDVDIDNEEDNSINIQNHLVKVRIPVYGTKGNGEIYSAFKRNVPLRIELKILQSSLLEEEHYQNKRLLIYSNDNHNTRTRRRNSHMNNFRGKNRRNFRGGSSAHPNNWNWSRGGGGNNQFGGGPGGGGRGGGGGGGGYNAFGNNFQSFGPPPPPHQMSFNENYGNNEDSGPPPSMENNWGPGGPQNGGGGGGHWEGSQFSLNPASVLQWLDSQNPFVIRRVLFHCKWLCDQYGIPYSNDGNTADESWFEDATCESEGNTSDNNQHHSVQNEPTKQNKNKNKKSRRPGFGFGPHPAQSQWTPEGWVIKDNSHKVTTKAKNLPPPDIIPPFSTAYPDASNDKDKLKMLKNNVSMMTSELNKICRRFKITALNKEDLSEYPEDQREKLKTAIGCVSGAEKTLEDFKDFVKNEKYKEWNEEQERIHQERIKEMIGETPDGIAFKKPKLSSTETNEEQEQREQRD